MIKAELIAVGSELLTPYRSDTNTLWITGKLNEAGVRVTRKHIIGDDRESIAMLFRDAASRVDIIIACGGLGPTFDDVTREALADACGLELEYHEEIWDWICARYRLRGRVPTENNRRQAMVPVGAAFCKNDVGTAPGLLLKHGGTRYLLLPGPPIEMEFVYGRLSGKLLEGLGATPISKKIFKLVGIPESAVDDALKDFPLPEGMEWSILAAYGQVEIHFSYQGDDANVFGDAAKELEKRFGIAVFGTDDDTLESVVGDLLRRHGHTIAVAESCSGGWLAKRLTNTAGSSDYFLQGVVSYSNEAKQKLLGVREQTLIDHGAVSEPTALEMARGIRGGAGSDISVAITGIAGPGGGTEEKPVGLVYIAVIGPGGEEMCFPFLFPGDRDKVRYQATQFSLAMIRSFYFEGAFDSLYFVGRKG